MKLLAISVLTTVFLVGCGGAASTKPTNSVMTSKVDRAAVVADERTDKAVDKVTTRAVDGVTGKILDMLPF